MANKIKDKYQTSHFCRIRNVRGGMPTPQMMEYNEIYINPSLLKQIPLNSSDTIIYSRVVIQHMQHI
jgi:hypothetical protein